MLMWDHNCGTGTICDLDFKLRMLKSKDTETLINT